MSVKELFETFRNYQQWHKRKNIDYLMSYFSDDPLVAIGTAPGEIAFGRYEIKQLYLEALEEIKDKTIQLPDKSNTSYKGKILGYSWEYWLFGKKKILKEFG